MVDTGLVPSQVKVVRGPDLHLYERPDAIIPYRNVYLILAALNKLEKEIPMEKLNEYTPQNVEICLGATAGDRVLDKSPEFAGQLSNLLTYLSRPQHWTASKSRNIKVVLPYKDYTKRDLIREYLGDSTGGRRDELLRVAWEDSLSCYHPNKNGEPCGMCKPCFRKTVAFTLEGYINPEYISRAAIYIQRTGILDQIKQGTYGRGKQEEQDILDFMQIAYQTIFESC